MEGFQKRKVPQNRNFPNSVIFPIQPKLSYFRSNIKQKGNFDHYLIASAISAPSQIPATCQNVLPHFGHLPKKMAIASLKSPILRVIDI